VIDDLFRAQYRQQTQTAAYHEDESPPEDLIGGGGPLVKCLRMLAVSGMGLI
jgi:hypothetical protein